MLGQSTRNVRPNISSFSSDGTERLFLGCLCHGQNLMEGRRSCYVTERSPDWDSRLLCLQGDVRLRRGFRISLFVPLVYLSFS